MKKTCFLAAVLLLAAVMIHAGPETASTGEDSPEKARPLPAPKVDLSELHGHRASLSVTTDGGARRGLALPEAEEAACGLISGLGKGKTSACVITNRPDREWESLILDLNDNKDLTDDPAHALQIGEEVSEIVVSHRGADHRFRVAISHQGNYYALKLHPLGFLEGSDTVDAKSVAWHVADCNLSGAIDEGDAAYITFDGRPWDRYRGHMMVLDATSAVREDGCWYGVRWRKEGSGLDLDPFGGELHTLKIDATALVPDPPKIRCQFVRYGMGRSARMFDADLVAGVEFPAGRLGYLSGYLKTEPGQLHFVMRGLELDKDTALKFGEPSAQVVLKQTGDEIFVSQNCVAAHNVVYTLARGKVGPKVELFAPGDAEKPVFSGNLEYG